MDQFRSFFWGGTSTRKRKNSIVSFSQTNSSHRLVMGKIAGILGMFTTSITYKNGINNTCRVHTSDVENLDKR